MSAETEREPRVQMSDDPLCLYGRKVIKGHRVTIPSRERETYGIEAGDWFHVYIESDDYEFYVLDARVTDTYRITIPSRKRDRYGVEVGDVVNVHFIPDEEV